MVQFLFIFHVGLCKLRRLKSTSQPYMSAKLLSMGFDFVYRTRGIIQFFMLTVLKIF